MAALGVRFGGSRALRSGDDLWQNHRQLPLRKNARPITISCQIGSGTKMMRKLKSQSESESKSKPRLCLEGFGGGKNEALAREKMDEWMRDSVAEIVKNLRGAPLLVEVYSDRNGGGTRLKTEKAVAQDWPLIQSIGRSTKHNRLKVSFWWKNSPMQMTVTVTVTVTMTIKSQESGEW